MVRIGQFQFDGPLYSETSLNRQPGVYAILNDRGAAGVFVLDVGESESIHDRVACHDRTGCWRRHRQGTLAFAALYTPGLSGVRRRQIEAGIRQQYTPTCGVR